MTRALVVMLLLALGGVAQAEVPGTISFTARLVDDESGQALTGTKHVTFELFAASSGGQASWSEQRDLELDDGLAIVALGETEPFDASVLDGSARFLQVTVDGTVMEPRIALTSVPFAVRASDTDSIGGVTVEQLQQRIASGCTGGTFLTGVNADGTVTCAPDTAGSGDITDVVAGSGLEGGGTAGSVTMRLLSTCQANQILKWSGTTWACAADAGSTAGAGDITSVTVGPAGGLSGGNTTGDVSLSLLTTCSLNQVLKWNGSTWACAADLDTDTNSGGDITGVIVGANGGLTGGAVSGDATVSLQSCTVAGQILKWNGSAWACGVDNDTSSGGDITGITAGNGLTGDATSGNATLNVVGGSGVVVAADSVTLDFPALDARWVNATGDSMTGLLNMNNNQITNRGCPTGYTKVGGGLCAETADQSGFTFTGCANRCRNAGTHMCSSAEMRGIIASGIALSSSTLYDWMDDQDADNSALYVSQVNAEDPDAARATTTSSPAWCRCCANAE